MNALDQLLAKGDLPRAKAEAERLLAANPQDAAALVAMAKIHLVDGQLDAAEPFIARAEALGPSPQAHLLRGNVFGQKGQLAEAEEQYRKALQLDPTLAEA